MILPFLGPNRAGVAERQVKANRLPGSLGRLPVGRSGRPDALMMPRFYTLSALTATPRASPRTFPSAGVAVSGLPAGLS